MTQPRTPQGVPTGGQFTASQHTEATVSLDPPRSTVEQVQDGVWVVISPDDGRPVTRAAPITNMVRNRTAGALAVEGQGGTPTSRFNALSGSHIPVTVLGQNRHGVTGIHHGIATRTADGRAVLEPHSGMPVDFYTADVTILGCDEGYVPPQEVADRFEATTRAVPSLTDTNFDGIPEFSYDDPDAGDEPPNDIAAVYVTASPGGPPGALFLATDFTREDGIVNGYYWAPEASGRVSEHGSMFAADLRRDGARVANYKPGALTFSDCLQGKLGTTRQDAYRHLTPPATA